MPIRVIVVVGILLGLAVLGCWIFTAARGALNRRRHAQQEEEPWKVKEISDGVHTEVWLVHPTQKNIYIDEVPASLQHWEHQERLEEIRVEAEAKAADKNSRLLA